MHILLYSEAIVCSLILLYMAYISHIERERRARDRAIIIGIISLISISTIAYLSNLDGEWSPLYYWLGVVTIATPSLFIATITVSMIIVPTTSKGRFPIFRHKLNVDERQTMFSRMELQEGTENYKQFYRDNPELEADDRATKNLPGLLSKDSKFYNPLVSRATSSTFHIIKHLHSLIPTGDNRGDSADDITREETQTPEQLTKFVKGWIEQLGAHSVGIAKMEEHHYYTTGGRSSRYNKKRGEISPYGICFTVEMDREMTSAAPDSSIVLESSTQYLKSGIISLQIAEFIKQLGFNARAHIDGNYEVICPMVAKDAGLGEISRMSLLITPKLGARVRLGVITTDIPLIPDTPTHNESVLHFCTICKKCADTCPSKSISTNNRGYGEGWSIDQTSCFKYWCRAGTDCGRCMATCPYSHNSNLLHNIVRWGMSRSKLFRYCSLYMDTLFYGERPKSKDVPNWCK